MQRVADCAARSEGSTGKTEDMVAIVLQTYNSVQRCLDTCKNLFCEQSGMLVTAAAGGLWT